MTSESKVPEPSKEKEWESFELPGELELAAKLPPPEPFMDTSLSEDLREAWIEYMKNGFKNNEIMFKRTLEAFMKPYNITIWMYVIIFVVGILFFALAAYLGLMGDQPVLSIGFGGLSVVTFIAFFIRQPVQALEENLEFISWLCVAFNTYWTRLMYISNADTVHKDLKDATNDYSKTVEHIIDKHATIRRKRSGKELTEFTPSNEKSEQTSQDSKS